MCVCVCNRPTQLMMATHPHLKGVCIRMSTLGITQCPIGFLQKQKPGCPYATQAADLSRAKARTQPTQGQKLPSKLKARANLKAKLQASASFSIAGGTYIKLQIGLWPHTELSAWWANHVRHGYNLHVEYYVVFGSLLLLHSLSLSLPTSLSLVSLYRFCWMCSHASAI